MKTVLFFIMLTVWILPASAQSVGGKISGTVGDSGGNDIPGVTVKLQQMLDTSVKKITVTDAKGAFAFGGLMVGHYLLTCSAIGYQPYSSLPITLDNSLQTIGLPRFVLLPAAAKALNEVVISASRPLIEHKIDRTVVNIDAMLSATGSNALEVLGKSPGVFVDPNGNISLNGRGGVLVLIDDKPTYLSASDLASYLRSLPGGSLDQIELMTNPPAKYDASGSAIINIKLKKNRAAGFNGNVSASFNAGQYLRSNDALNLNYRSGKLNVFANLSYTRDANFTQNDGSRSFYSSDAATNSLLQVDSRYAYLSNGWNARTGLDYFTGPNTTIGLLLTGGLRPSSDRTAYNGKQYDASGALDSVSTGFTDGSYHWYNGGVNINFQQKLDQHGQILSADLDHLRYDSDGIAYSSNCEVSSTSLMKYLLPSDINIYSAKTDYTLPFNSNGRLEAGLKSSWVTAENNDQWFTNDAGAYIPDYSLSDHFIYTENINAAYISAQQEWRRWGVKGGLRLENTRDDGHQFSNPAVPDSSFTKSYYSLFPSFYLSYKLDTAGAGTLGFMYSRRVHRPNYQQLNPFLAYQNQFTYSGGNPGLDPNFYQIFQVSYAFRQFFDVSFAYIGSNNDIYNITSLSGDNFITRPENFAINNSLNLHADLSLSPIKNWDVNAGGLLFHLINRGNGYGTYINDAVTTGEIELFNSFHISKDWSAELNGGYHGPFHGGQTIAGSSWFYNFAIQKKLFNGQGSLRFRADNLFHTVVSNRTMIGINGVSAFSSVQNDTSLAGVSFQYSFGKAAKDRKRDHSTGAEDEQDRTK